MTSSPKVLRAVQQKIWDGRIPLRIHLASEESIATSNETPTYYTTFPRLSYIPILLPKLHAFFFPYLADPTVSAHQGWLSYDGVPLKWHFPIGLLYDLYSGASGHSLEDDGSSKRSEIEPEDSLDLIPWKIELRFRELPELLIPLDADGKTLRDVFTNSAKEASFLRTGGGKVVMGLSKDDSTQLWTSVETNNLKLFNIVNQKLLHPPGVALRHIPLKVYLPTAGQNQASTSLTTPSPGHLKVVQTLVTPNISSRQPQTLGTALNALLPTLFPSRRSPLLALPILHGAVLPLSSTLEELGEWASFADGWLHMVVVMMS